MLVLMLHLKIENFHFSSKLTLSLGTIRKLALINEWASANVQHYCKFWRLVWWLWPWLQLQPTEFSILSQSQFHSSMNEVSFHVLWTHRVPKVQSPRCKQIMSSFWTDLHSWCGAKQTMSRTVFQRIHSCTLNIFLMLNSSLSHTRNSFKISLNLLLNDRTGVPWVSRPCSNSPIDKREI